MTYAHCESRLQMQLHRREVGGSILYFMEVQAAAFSCNVRW